MTEYFIIPSINLTEALVADCQQDSTHTVRKSLDGKLAILSTEDRNSEAILKYQQLHGALLFYTERNMLDIVASSQWTAIPKNIDRATVRSRSLIASPVSIIWVAVTIAVVVSAILYFCSR